MRNRRRCFLLGSQRQITFHLSLVFVIPTFGAFLSWFILLLPDSFLQEFRFADVCRMSIRSTGSINSIVGTLLYGIGTVRPFSAEVQLSSERCTDLRRSSSSPKVFLVLEIITFRAYFLNNLGRYCLQHLQDILSCSKPRRNQRVILKYLYGDGIAYSIYDDAHPIPDRNWKTGIESPKPIASEKCVSLECKRLDVSTFGEYKES